VRAAAGNGRFRQFAELQQGLPMHPGFRRAVRRFGLALVACHGLAWYGAVPAPARADEAGVLALLSEVQAADSETPAPPLTEDDPPFADDTAPPPAQEGEEEEDGSFDGGCLFLERPLELIV
jgi:hypothetical protein